MAIPSKPEKTNPCSNCGFPVKARRPASSGQHFCQEKACQAAKQRFYRTRGATLGSRAAMTNSSNWSSRCIAATGRPAIGAASRTLSSDGPIATRRG